MTNVNSQIIARGGGEDEKKTTPRRKPARPTVGAEIIASVKEAIAWAGGEDVPARVTTVDVPTVDVGALRRNLGLSQQIGRSEQTPKHGRGL